MPDTQDKDGNIQHAKVALRDFDVREPLQVRLIHQLGPFWTHRGAGTLGQVKAKKYNPSVAPVGERSFCTGIGVSVGSVRKTVHPAYRIQSH